MLPFIFLKCLKQVTTPGPGMCYTFTTAVLPLMKYNELTMPRPLACARNPAGMTKTESNLEFYSWFFFFTGGHFNLPRVSHCAWPSTLAQTVRHLPWHLLSIVHSSNRFGVVCVTRRLSKRSKFTSLLAPAHRLFTLTQPGNGAPFIIDRSTADSDSPV